MSAVISECGQYRYVLRRSLGSALRWYKPMLFIMLNPSTADAEKDDPTVRRCKYFAEREGATHLTVVNLFALRATDPRALSAHPDPVGPDNDKHLIEECKRHSLLPIVAAWGSNKFAELRALDVVQKTEGRLFCLGKTKSGSPRHPLYVNSKQELIEL